MGPGYGHGRPHLSAMHGKLWIRASASSHRLESRGQPSEDQPKPRKSAKTTEAGTWRNLEAALARDLHIFSSWSGTLPRLLGIEQ
mmetsp:Transcript_62674/g.176719  ORF Transcript_62674/g.176719 Transcript_62674/m.176719 type:complete len:85 (+) Transcript_62674:718-972(+)